MKINITAKPGTTKKNKTGGWRTFKPKVNFEKCIGCGLCSRICPEGIIEMENDKAGKPKPKVDYDYCKGCGACAAECPAKAIIMELDKK
jgi:2-oxoacid:acceptor oxidoreductase delta subunit (pyruvate/2-ketoisovalerate family)